MFGALALMFTFVIHAAALVAAAFLIPALPVIVRDLLDPRYDKEPLR